MKIAMIGCGAIGSAALKLLRDEPKLSITQVVVPDFALAAARDACATLAPHADVRTALDLQGAARPDLVVECAGHAAISEHVVPALEAGIDAIVASVGAMSDATLMSTLNDTAKRGGARAELISGAIGGIDALSSARLGGLLQVTYVGRKPPLGWLGTPAEKKVDLHNLKEATVIFEGSARDAARLYPKNANVAATVSLAGLGLDETHATLIADPNVTRNVHKVTAEGAFGRLELQLENFALPDNPKTSALTVMSLARAVRNRVSAVAL